MAKDRTFEYNGKTYIVQRCKFKNGFPYVQVFYNGKPYGQQVVPSLKMYMKYLLKEDPDFWSSMENVAEKDITSGMWDKFLTHKKKDKQR